jgi:hypothetical protein
MHFEKSNFPTELGGTLGNTLFTQRALDLNDFFRPTANEFEKRVNTGNKCAK